MGNSMPAKGEHFLTHARRLLNGSSEIDKASSRGSKVVVGSPGVILTMQIWEVEFAFREYDRVFVIVGWELPTLAGPHCSKNMD